MSIQVRAVRESLRRWAASRQIDIDEAGYTRALDDNLFQPLSRATRAEFEAGDGDELGRSGARGKMQALHSSSALAVNVFDYWRDRDAAPIAHAMGVERPIEHVSFEQRYPTGLPGNAPNLDVVLQHGGGLLLAIESKFLEPYGRHATGFKPKYFPDTDRLWASRGLGACELLANRIQAGDIAFRWLNAEQLLKHILGLATSAPATWSLGYAWYRVPGAPGDEHAAEVALFADAVAPDPFEFASWTYQDVIADLARTCGPEHAAYVAYLDERYVASSV